jgi:hypothetical protein
VKPGKLRFFPTFHYIGQSFIATASSVPQDPGGCLCLSYYLEDILRCSLLLTAALSLLTFLPQPAAAQTDSLVDVFPLEIGNGWVYRWETVERATGQERWVDTGSAVYNVTQRIVTHDSIRWIIHERRFLLRGNFGSYYPWDSHEDSTDFEVVEKLTGRHQLIRVPSFDVYDPAGMFPFFPRYDLPVLTGGSYLEDTTKIYRYWVMPQGRDSFSVAAGRYVPLSGGSTYKYTFVASIGMQNIYQHGYAPGHHNWGANHVLREAFIGSRGSPGLLDHFALYDNYPNPFNTQTTIRYVLPNRSHVTLSVFNTLGQQVAWLVDGEVEAGNHAVSFDALGLASGVYFYRLHAGAHTQTRTMCLVR